MNINYKEKLLDFLKIPAIPKKEWDKRSYFNKGVAIIESIVGSRSYAVCCYSESSERPYITKVFDTEPFKCILSIYPVPDYMDNDVDKFDLDENSLDAIADLLEERDIEIGADAKDDDSDEDNEWVYPFIHSREEAIAYLRSQGGNNAKGLHLIKSDETIKMRLLINKEEQNRKVKR